MAVTYPSGLQITLGSSSGQAGSRKPRVAIFDMQGKSRGIVQALGSQGHELVGTARADVVFVDYDGPWADPRQTLIEQCVDHGGIVLVYPHGGGAPAVYDGVTHPDMRVTAHLVQPPGHAEILRRINFPLPVHVIGWFYSEMVPFTRPTEVRTVLFGPRHPLGDGTTYDPDRETNRRIYEQLLKLDVDIVLQMVGSWDQNGLWPSARTRLVVSDMTLQHVEIDKADVVIADQTMGHLAVARGKPVLMPGQFRPLDPTNTRGARNWHLYGEYMRYPYDLDDGNADLAEVMHAACEGGPELDSWRALFVGEPLKPAELSTLVTRLYEERH